MFRKFIMIIVCISCLSSAIAQKNTPNNEIDSLAYYTDLFNELESFLDSLLTPRSMLLINVGAGNSFLNYESSAALRANQVITFFPSVGYFHKSGFGINAAANVVNDKGTINPYQLGLTASYDYLQKRTIIGGVSFTRYFTKDSLSFYTSPLQNEIYGYVSYRKWWIKPSISASYGWGSKTEMEKRRVLITNLRESKNNNGNGSRIVRGNRNGNGRRNGNGNGNGNGRGNNTVIDTISGITHTITTENVSDLSVTVSVKHDFYWLNVLFKKDYFRLTPQISFVSGTQRFGFNQVANFFRLDKKSAVSNLYSSKNVTLEDTQKFQPLSLAGFLKSEFSMGKFFLQPTVIFNYYLPGTDNIISTTFNVNTGFIF
ncbi:MAG: hypothetical protein ICV51_04585 [Flavisolibacter sp.]|nr:hypothetical protein [Flavisolibacter sp.]